MALADLERVSYWYPATLAPALDRVCAAIEPGLTLVTGPSGGGKSTLLRVLNGLVPRFHGGRMAGRARVAGLAVPETPVGQLARSVGFVFQDPESQAVYATVERDVAFGLENLGLPRREMSERVDFALAAVGIEELRSRRVTTLSGGERQRAALAAVLALRPRLVVLDEPTSQLDAAGSALLIDSCLTLAKGGMGVVVSEHRVRRLARAAKQRLHLEQGRLVNGGSLPPRLAGRVGRGSSRGVIAWSLEGIAAGPGREPVLEGVDLAGQAGEIVVLTGPNGGGKTTLLRVIAGLLKPRAGRAERRPGPAAYLPQNPSALLHRPTLWEEVELTIRRSGNGGRPDAILAELGLAAVATRYPRDLSTGERQRAAIAAVLAGRPSLVLLDEPTRGMDERARETLVRLARRLADEGTAVVVATHDIELTAGLADRVVMVSGGRAVEKP